MSDNASPLNAPCAPSNSDSIVDLFADVSHHGSSLFELFSLPTPGTVPSSVEPAPHLSLVANQHIDTTTYSPETTSILSKVDLVDNSATCNVSVGSPQRSSSKLPNSGHVAVANFAYQPRPSRISAPPIEKSMSTNSLPPHAAISKPPRRTRTSPPKSAPTIRPRPPLTPVVNDESEASDASGEAAVNLSKRSKKLSDDVATSSARRPLSLRASKSASQPNSNADSSNHSDPPTKRSHDSHTRRCRAKVNSKFQELLGILPAPPANTGIKHKAQILDYTIRVFRDIHARKTFLEAELALSSRAHLTSWVDSIVARAFSLQDLLGPYLSLICTKGGWKYSEAWVGSKDPSLFGGLSTNVDVLSCHSRILTQANSSIEITSKLRLGLAVIPALGNSEDPELQGKLERFRDKSRPYGCKARVDLPGRILCTMRPEWLPSLDDNEAFQRARLATDASLVMCFGVPVFVRGDVAAVALFFDTEQRAYDAKSVDLADNVASLLGNSYGNSAVRKARCR